MIISIDYDDTFTSDKQLWSGIIDDIQAADNEVVCVSYRFDSKENRDLLKTELPDDVFVMLTGGKAKEPHARSMGVIVDIWIDDKPETVTQDE